MQWNYKNINKAKKVMTKFSDWFNAKLKSIDEYLKKGPERRQAEIDRLKQEVLIEKLKAQKRKLRDEGRPKEHQESFTHKMNDFDYIGDVFGANKGKKKGENIEEGWVI